MQLPRQDRLEGTLSFGLCRGPKQQDLMSLQKHSTVLIFHTSCIACESLVSRMHTAPSEAATLHFPLDTEQIAEIKSIES
jgi:hypothetical protein